MDTFLQLVARDLCNKVGDGIGQTAVVFPNKRASLFLMNIWQQSLHIRYGHLPT